MLTLFTAKFGPMRDLFGWQMAGDTVKIGSWLLGYVLLARTRWILIPERRESLSVLAS
jgi:PST family polysaccharide transporter